MKNSEIIENVCIILYPLMLLFGFYVIIFGDRSPGGGFQGGVVLATAFLSTLFIRHDNEINVKMLTKLEKYLFCIILITASVSLITRGQILTNFFPIGYHYGIRRYFLVLVNLLIGLKVASGLTLIFTLFVEEGK
ncbi:MAG: MnhB domain-containing protein [Alkaliphilus sp.]